MIDHLPFWIPSFFLLLTIVSLLLFYYSNGKSSALIIVIILYSIFQSIVGYLGFYLNTTTVPPRMLLVLLGMVIAIGYGMKKNELLWMMNNRNLLFSTLLHTLRAPVEIVLFNLYLNKMIPELMTFEGRNYDILIGLSAPIIAFLFYKKIVDKRVLLIWNYIGLGFVLFIFINATLAVEAVTQQWGFDQPNRAVLYFPFVLLPATIVPIVIYTHITDIIKLRRELIA